MAFPGTYNISYYLGDTHEFRIYPKNADGSIFELTDYSTFKFIIAPTRGAPVADQIAAFAAVDQTPNGTSILCAIRPEDGARMDPTVQYVYDIEIVKPQTATSNDREYDIVHTVLTGNLTITQDITTEESGAPEPLPNNPSTLVVGNITDTTIQVSWSAPVSGGQVDAYKLAIIPFTTDFTDITTAIQNSTTSISFDNTSYTFFGLTENTEYTVLILSTNETGDANYSTVLTNENAITTGDNPNTIEPDFFVTNDGNTAFLIDGVANDTITVMRGQTYTLSINAAGHPFWIQTVPSTYSAVDAYNEGVANNGAEVGTITWTVAQNAPDTLFYVCQNHPANMGGIIAVVDGES